MESRDPMSLSQRLWELDWQRHFPRQLSVNVRAEPCTFAEAREFASENAALIYGDDPARIPFLVRDESTARQEFYAAAGDLFLFKTTDRNVGFFAGNALD